MTTSNTRPGPLSGVRILDLTWVISGPFATMLLADLGAEVIKVEPPAGDMARAIPPTFFGGDSAFFHSVNHNKKSVVLDLKSAEGRRTFEDLVRVSDVVYNNFSPRAARSLGVHYDALKEINPSVIASSIYGFHDEEPYEDLPAFDSVIQAMGGVMSITGDEGGRSARVGYQIGDLAGGLYSVIATLSALHERGRTGTGSDVAVSLFDSQLSLLTWQAQSYLINGEVPRALGTKHPMIVPNQAFPTKDGREIVVSATGDRFWRAFCQAIDRPDLADDSRYATQDARVAHRATLDPVLDEILSRRTRDEWLGVFTEARIPAGPVLNVAEALSHPVAALRDMVVTAEHSAGPLRVLGNPIKTGDAPAPVTAAPRLGEHTAEILTDLLGRTAEQSPPA